MVACARDKQMPLKILCVAIEVPVLPDVRPITRWSRDSFSPSAIILGASSFCVAHSCGRAPDNGERDILIITLSAVDLLLMGATRKGTGA